MNENVFSHKNMTIMVLMILLASVLIGSVYFHHQATLLKRGDIFVCQIGYEVRNGVNFTKVWSFGNPNPKNRLIGWFYTTEKIELNKHYHVTVVQDYIVSLEEYQP